MKYRFLCCSAALSLGAALSASATTVTTTFSNTYFARQSLFGGASSSSFNFEVDLGIVDFSAKANSGTVTSTVSSVHSLGFSDTFTLSQASSASFSHSVTSLRGGYSTAYGATAQATAGIGDFRFSILDEGASVTTSRSNNTSISFGSALIDTDRDALVGQEIAVPIISPVVAATINLEQRSIQRINSVTGIIEARHSSGAVVSKAYSLDSFSVDTFALDLGLVGAWDIFALNMDAFGTFDADFGTSSTGTVGYRIGFNCGDVTTDADNEFGCVDDNGASITTSTVYVRNGTPFGLNFSDLVPIAQPLGRVNVTADPVDPPSAVPLPAGAILLLSGLGALAVNRRRTSRRKPS